MSDFGKLVKHVYDEYGPIQVFDDGNKRFLMFGNDDEQGCILKQSPELIQYAYVRAMLLPLLFDIDVNNCLVLGLGSGALAHSLFTHFPSSNFTVVELRQKVIDIAYSHFSFPRSNQINVHHMDAGHFLGAEKQTNTFDLVFSDIYGAEGMDKQQGNVNYFDECFAKVSEEGWLVLNFWHDHKSVELLAHMYSQCAQVWANNINTGNWIVMATRSGKELSKKEIRKKAKDLSDQFGFSFHHVAASLKRIYPSTL